MIQETIFIAVAAITLLGAVLAVWLKNVFYNALALILCLAGVAALFIYLNSEFLAIIEVIIYIGAISIAIIFAIMLSQPMAQKSEKRQPVKILRSIGLATLLFGGIWAILRTTVWPNPGTEGDYSLQAIGKSLLTVNVLPFEVVSVILLIAIIGALVISASKETS
jgi:NADH-quinone oxidoreductase subunit J